MQISRDVIAESKRYLTDDRVHLYIGARQVGKTTILRILKEYLEGRGEVTHFVSLENPETLDLLNQHPENIFRSIPLDSGRKIYIFIDEVQYLDNPTNFLKLIYDEHKDRVKLLASGSSSFYIDKRFKDSLAGRKIIFNVYTLSFREFLDHKTGGKYKNQDLNGLGLSQKREVSTFYHEYMIYGGYPKVVLSDIKEKEQVLRDYVFSYIRRDMSESGVRKESEFYALLRVLAEQAAGILNASELSRSMGISRGTIDSYVHILEKSLHIGLLSPFHGRFKKEFIKMPKVYFLDLGIRNFLVGKFEGLPVRTDKGLLFENAVYRTLLDKNHSEDINFWRTTRGQEVDFVLEREKLAYEVKTNINIYNKRKYEAFLGRFKDFRLELVTIDKKENIYKGIKVRDIWEL